MIQITKQQLTSLFEGPQTMEQIAEGFAKQAQLPFETEADQKKMVKLTQELFKVQGFNLRSRKRKVATSWYTIIDDNDVEVLETV